MSNKKEYLYGICILSILVPVPGRLAYGIIIILLLNWLMFIGTLIKVAIKKLLLKELGSLALLSSLTALIVLFKEFLTLYSPVISLTMSFSLYIAGLSYFILGNIFNPDDKKILENSSLAFLVGQNMKKMLRFSGILLFFFGLRDILGYGSLTFPVPHGIAELPLFASVRSGGSSFFGTTSGVFVLVGIFIGIYSLFNKKRDIIIRSKK